MFSHQLSRLFVLPMLCLALIMSACSPYLSPATATPTPSPTPTVTPIPLAVSVNGEGVSMAEFDAEVARTQQSMTDNGQTAGLEDATQAAMDNLINNLLLEQGAAAQGYTVDDATLQSHIDDLTAQIGGVQLLSDWESAHGYTDADFRSELRRELAAAWMRDQIAASVPKAAEQVHVKQILLYNLEDAQQAIGYLQAGRDFNDLAARYDPITKGELGWFPRGYLSDPAIEEAAFALQVGQYSDIIQTEAGYHILYLEERDPARLLSPDALLTLQEHAVQDWLTEHRNESTILFAP